MGPGLGGPSEPGALQTRALRPRERKDPGPEDPALVHPWKGVLCDLADFNLLLEYWSVGVLEIWRQDKHPPGMETEINGILSAYALRDLDHYSNTPLLQHSITPTLSGSFQGRAICL